MPTETIPNPRRHVSSKKRQASPSPLTKRVVYPFYLTSRHLGQYEVGPLRLDMILGTVIANVAEGAQGRPMGPVEDWEFDEARLVVQPTTYLGHFQEIEPRGRYVEGGWACDG
jgi:hypothetical protein